MDSSLTAPEPMYLIWSNDAGAWWGPGGHGYRGSDLWAAGRFTRANAVERCGMRNWPSRIGRMPPEVMIPAPENGSATFNADQIRDMPRVISALVEQASRDAASDRERERKACRWCESGGEPGRGQCRCAFRCGYGGCCSSGNPGRSIFDCLTSREV